MKLTSIFSLIPSEIAYAHCDIPCGIYDPHNAQMAAHTVIRMTELLGLIKRGDELKAEHDVSRVTHVKEEHASLLEKELFTLRHDYFKDEQMKEYSNLQDLFYSALKSNTKARQGIDMEAAKETLETVMQIAEIFYESKDLKSKRVKAPYPTGLDIVVQA